MLVIRFPEEKVVNFALLLSVRRIENRINDYEKRMFCLFATVFTLREPIQVK